MQAARERHRVRERRFDQFRFAGIDEPMRNVERFQHAGRAAAALKFLVGAKNLQHAASAVVIGDADLLAQRDQARLAVVGDALHARLVVRKALRCAVAQESGKPPPLSEVDSWTQHQRRMAREQPAHDLERHAGRGPRAGEARAHAARVGEARLQRRPRLTIDHGHLVAGLGEVVGAGRADHARAQNHDPHGESDIGIIPF